MLKIVGWNINTLITIIVGGRGVIHKHSMKALETPTKNITKVVKYTHQIVIKYLTYLILNKRS
jgi:hypothetical protein